MQPPLKADLQISEAQIGDLQMAFILAYCFSQLFVGYLGDRFQRRTVLVCSLGSSVLSLGGIGLVNSFSSLILLRIVLGISQSASVPAIAGVMGDCFTAKTRSTAVGIYLISQNVALMVAGCVGGEIADIPTWTLPEILGAPTINIAGWRMAMFIFSFVGALVVLAMYLFLREPQRSERQPGQGLGVEGGSLWRTALSIAGIFGTSSVQQFISTT